MLVHNLRQGDIIGARIKSFRLLDSFIDMINPRSASSALVGRWLKFLDIGSKS